MTDEDRKLCEARIVMIEAKLAKLDGLDDGAIAPGHERSVDKLYVYEARHNLESNLRSLRRMLATPDAL